MHEELPVTAFHNCVISHQADRWFIAFKYEIEKPAVPLDRPLVGVDIGINVRVVTRDGRVYSKNLQKKCR